MMCEREIDRQRECVCVCAVSCCREHKLILSHLVDPLVSCGTGPSLSAAGSD